MAEEPFEPKVVASPIYVLSTEEVHEMVGAEGDLRERSIRLVYKYRKEVPQGANVMVLSPAPHEGVTGLANGEWMVIVMQRTDD
jgi:hypothetical protein